MNRQLGMWILIICILVVGVSVTKMTNEFVSSNGVETAAISSIEDKSDALVPGAEPSAGLFTMESAVAEETAEEQMMMRAMPEEADGSSNVSNGPVGKERAVGAIANDSAESVKSPLDPSVEYEGPFVEEKIAGNLLDSGYFLERFAAVESGTSILWEKVSPDHVSSYYTAAEQEYASWDHELNLVYSAIRERLPAEDADQLKALELEWMKERDQYANKMMASSKNPAMQSVEYLQALTAMTKERCFWLVNTYSDVLDLKE